jgi:hypothetical protein
MPRPLQRSTRCASVLLLAGLSACGNLLQDNGTHLAYALETGADALRRSNLSEWTVRYETLDGPGEPFYVEITPSLPPGQTSGVWSSYIVVSGRTGGGTSYHNRFVYVPQRLYIKKDHGGPVELQLRRDGGRIDVTGIR